MTRSGLIGGCAVMLLSTTAQAQNAAKAFECNMPYRETMMAMGGLAVVSQTPVKGFPGLHGDGELISFATTGAQVFGIQPDKLSVEVLQPHRWQAKPQYKVTFAATFARATSTDEAIQRSVEWHILCGARSFCQNTEASRPAGGGRIEYRREAELTLSCIFEFTEAEFEALGQ